ncbi:MAG TPA: nucleotidyl transferase AbiEii/AbiGii toxin family protein [Sediminibacterium sp.]|nr:nucleotidyl transferase AbiEii/AbiGii toxin family protein [Sediminibacterium sp.]HQS56708.1 nucleotidyl transferase AbiEii/AbiGii toxin family protein [Sediminibacterium sp.]
MIAQKYSKQVALLLRVIPEIAKESCFGLHGGTAINLFIRDMPRLSVDIDLTYLPIEDRDSSIKNISEALSRIKESIENKLSGVVVDHKKENFKLLVTNQGVGIKVEVNPIMRGIYGNTQNSELSNKAQSDFQAYCAINTVPIGQLYGGKICAALDRQHPRDLFDVKYLLNSGGFTQEIKEGLFLRLLSGERPIHEILFPNFQDQRLAMENQFSGMTEEAFSYEEYEAVREELVRIIHENITDADKDFLLAFKSGIPNWGLYNFEMFPSIKWKLQNIQKLKETNSAKHLEQYESLKEKLNSIQ